MNGAPSISVKRNIFANYIGSFWTALMGLAFIPLYIRFLGMEAFGLIGVFSVLQAWLALLDIGLGQTMSREMARFRAGTHSPISIRDLLRSMEVIYVLLAVLVAAGVMTLAPWLATRWLTLEKLPSEVVAQALAITGAVVALRLPAGLYRSALNGLHEQVWLNASNVFFATLRGVGVVTVLAWISPTIQAFFIFQGCAAGLETAVLWLVLHRLLPGIDGRAHFSWDALGQVWRFAGGIVMITVLSLLLTQVDKLLLAGLLPLTAFGHYTLAGLAANAILMVVAPITTAFYPRLTELVTRRDEGALRISYHQAAQLVTVLTGAAGIVLIVFPDKLLLLWSGDAALTSQVAPLLAVLALGNLLNALMWVPYNLQLAHGWTGLALKVNVAAVAVLVPALLWIVPKYGAIGAAWVWVALNAGNIAVTISLMHRRLLTMEKWRWYGQDVALPLAAGLGVAGVCRWVVPAAEGRLVAFIVLVLVGGSVLLAAALVAPTVRHQIPRHLPRWMRPGRLQPEE